MTHTKPFPVTKRMVWEAWKKVKANGGGAGVDGQTLEAFGEDLGNNLYKVWNRMASGSYHPKAVRRVDIPKPGGGTRPLGIPTVTDCIAQMVVKRHLEPDMDPKFHVDSYGYRPKKSAHQALQATRQRCWRRDWVLDLDIKAFFDEIDHELLMRAVKVHTQERWVLLYIQRWLTAPVQLPDGTIEERGVGTPQGGVISPLLANLFLHYACDKWMERKYPDIPFARHADDAVCHCRSERQAVHLRRELERRFAQCKLRLHPDKTRIVYCKDGKRRGRHPLTSFDFLGYTFRARKSRSRRGAYFTGFNPAISRKAQKAIRQTIRGWQLQIRTGSTLEELSRLVNSTARGWAHYYGAFHRSVLHPVLQQIDKKLTWWAVRKYKRFRGSPHSARKWLRRVRARFPGLFAHWQFCHATVA